MLKARIESLREDSAGQSCFEDSHGITDSVIRGHPINIRGNPVNMKIGIDGRSLQDSPWSGVGQYTYGLLHALFELDRENEYVVWYNAFDIRRTVLRTSGGRSSSFPSFSEYPNVRVYRTRWPNKVLNAAIKVLGAPTPPNLPSRQGRGSPKAAGRGGNESVSPPFEGGVRGGVFFDVFFMPNLNFITLPVDTKLVLTVHDLSFEHFPEHFSKHTQLVHKAVNPRALVKRASKIIAVSEHTKDDLVEMYGVEEDKVSVVYPGIAELNNQATQQRNDKRVTPLFSQSVVQSVPYILYFGALEPRKNIEGLIEAFEQLNAPSPRGRGQGEGLVIAGLSTPYVAHLKRRIAKSPLRDRITAIANPSEKQKHALYASATLFVYPSFYEGFGFPPLEAMAAGVPVVASSASSVPEICDDAALLVSPWKIDEIKEGMRIMLEEDAVRKRYIEAGYRRVQNFSWESCARHLLDLFK